MIGTDDMSASAGMDISESFRAEDLSKTDFFDFVTAPDMGIGINVGVGVGVGVGVDVGVSLHHHHQHQQQQQHQQHHQQPHPQTQHSHNHGQVTTQTPQQALCGVSGARTSSSMIHDGGGGGGGGGGNGSTGVNGNGNPSGIIPIANRNGNTANNGNDPTLQGYEFWHQDKDTSRLDSSSIFEDLDRYCWQQQPITASNGIGTNASNQPSRTSPQSHQQHQQQQQQHQQNNTNPSNSSAASSAAGSSSDTISSLDTTDGQIYTLTVLNGGEPWLKRSEAEQLPSSLDLDSLLGSFPGYIKSEYPYDDSGFSTDGKDVNGGTGGGNGTGGSGGDGNGLSISQTQGQTLPSLVTAISIAGGNDLGQQLAQFQNNNNDWHMADHNADAEQSAAESLLRSALQGKGYGKGVNMTNGLVMPVVKDDDMRRLLSFTPDDAADALGFADSTLNAAQMFDDAQVMSGSSHLTVNSNHSQQQQQQQQHNGNASIIVDDMFLSLENAFSDDFEKIKRIANEVQQFCTAGTSTPTPVSGDFATGNDAIMMQISTSPALTGSTNQLQPPPPQPLKPEVSTSTSPRLGGVSKPKKQYKRTSSSSNNTSSNNNNNNNNANAINNNSTGNSGSVGGGNVLGVVLPSGSSGGSSSSSGSASSTSNSPPANSSSSSSGSSSTGGQRKERSLHYCSICSKGFKDKYSVNVHIRTHTGEKPFACSLCGKSFRQKAHLAKHYQTHMTQKNSGSMIKGSSSKQQRGNASGGGGGGGAGATGGSAVAAAAAAAAASATGGANLAQQRQLSIGPPSLPVMITNPNTPPSIGGVLPPANGLLANR